MKYLIQIGKNAKVAQTQLKNISDKKINHVLFTYKKLLIKNKKKILKQNAKDIKFCRRQSMVDRLMLTEQRLNSIIKSIQEIIKFKSPINRVLEKWKRSNGLTYLISRMKGQNVFAHITLEKGERSDLAELASNLL